MFTSTDNNGLLNDYGFQEAKARRNRMLERAQYDYSANELNRKLSQGMVDIGQKYSRGMEPQVTQYTGRGLGRSGIFQRAMKNYVESQQREVGDLTAGAQSALGELNLGEQAAGVSLQDELDRIQRAKYSEILNAAAQLKAWAPYGALYSGN
jgi:hypothetical protein